ncbi:PREDICTED: uncharacterized protein At5g39865-like [Nelumbo nucifera]|uniref:Uncharacterized protein At5g39865-like n=2 Tax=Nelumbo nucifera TaxID=4432 RepID=A0A1U8AYE6_NELNU|nr:PREDICTED: uncharacterized protein At5g39865-like [Nelumbo nucifera]DAD42702.1 TPA_asm: hypothetical protein HUJ06_000932 [Nelumbo nucifera]
MGCSVSRPEGRVFNKSATVETSATGATPPISRALSLPTPLVHHPPLKKGDTHHLVSLTSTTYGSLLLLDSDHNHSNPKFNRQDQDLDRLPASFPQYKALADQETPSPDSVINAWELMAGLDDFDYSAKSVSASSVRDSPKKPYPCPVQEGFVKKMCSSFESARSSPAKKNSVLVDPKVKKLQCNSFNSFDSSAMAIPEMEIPSSPSKPLWKHLSEESLLADLDPNVASSFRRALSTKQLGYNQSRAVRPVGSGAKVSPLFDNRIRLPGTEDRIVLYFTSLRGIRRTYEDCCTVRTIFKGFRVPVDERDISMDSAYRKELQSVLGEKTVSLPKVFIRGKYIGGADEIRQLHEVGELAKLFKGFPVREPGFVCGSCGDARFVPCLNCNGSRKVFDEEEEQLRRCPECNENGLIRCPDCSS